MCPTLPDAPAGTAVRDFGPYASGQRNATYTCADGTQSVLYCQNSSWTPGVEPCEPGVVVTQATLRPRGVDQDDLRRVFQKKRPVC